MWGVDGSQYYPGTLGAWSKIKVGWLDEEEITIGEGRYTLQPSWRSKDIVRIDYGFPEGEYLLLENREAKTWDEQIPSTGLLIWVSFYEAKCTLRRN